MTRAHVHPALSLLLFACTAPPAGGPGADSGDTDADLLYVFRQSSAVQVADHDALTALELFSWPDSIVGFATRPDDGAVFGFGFGRDGDIYRATFSPDGTQITASVRAPVGPTPPEGEWWGSGGPVYHDADSGLLLMVTHDENPDVQLRMAKSDDWGASWTDLGVIIDHHTAVGAANNRYMGNGGFVIHTEEETPYFYVYHGDSQSAEVRNQTAVSRAAVADVVAAALAGSTPEFHKWNGADWTEPGIGGASVELMPDFGVYGVVGDIDPYWVPALGRYYAFYPSQINGAVSPPTWNVLQSSSADGVHWTPAQKVYPEDLVGGDPIYIGLRGHNRVLTDEMPYLYRLWCTDNEDRWGSSTLDLVRLKAEPLEE
jgi:hypothetical protein